MTVYDTYFGSCRSNNTSVLDKMLLFVVRFMMDQVLSDVLCCSFLLDSFIPYSTRKPCRTTVKKNHLQFKKTKVFAAESA
jgi:hypothetical protein